MEGDIVPGGWLYPGPRDGLLIDEARGWRYECRDGALLEHRPGEEPRLLAAAGDVDRITIVPGDRLPASALLSKRFGVTEHDQALVLHTDAGPVAAVLVRLLAHQGVRDGAAARAAAGVARFAQGFGLPVERDEGTAAIESDLLGPGPVRARTRRDARLHLAVLGVCVVLWVVYGVLVAQDGVFAERHPVPLAAQAVLLVALTADLVRRRRRFGALVTSPPDLGGRQTVDGPGPWTLQVGADDVVLHGVAHEQWVPGPARGGVDHCLAHDDAFVFARGADPALVVPRAMVDDDALGRACRAAGIDVDRRRGRGIDAETEQRRTSENAGRVLSGTLDGGAVGNGFLFTPLVVAVSALLLVGSTLLDPERRGGAVGLVLGAVALGVLATQSVLWWTRRRWVASTRTGAAS